MADVTGDTRWKMTPMLGGLVHLQAEYLLSEIPAPGARSVATRAHAAVVPDFDWQTNGVLWGVTFRRYVPRNPTLWRDVLNRATGEVTSVLPPPTIPERTISGRIRTDGNDEAALWRAIEEAKLRCDATVKAGRPHDD